MRGDPTERRSQASALAGGWTELAGRQWLDEKRDKQDARELSEALDDPGLLLWHEQQTCVHLHERKNKISGTAKMKITQNNVVF